MRFLQEIQLSLDEAEALRLKELESLDQVQASQQMNVSRPTFQRILASARRKTADALLNGKAIRLEGGNWEMGENGLERINEDNVSKNGGKSVKIAVISDDGKTVSQHFGFARQYVVITIDNGKVTHKEARSKAGHATMQEHHVHDVPGQKHGYDAGAQSRHGQMMENIKDCQIVVAGGMGWGARDSLKSAGIDTIVTDIKDIEEVVALYIQGKLANQADRLH
jgi:predicted DNA-binding protein (UPF0251 family)/predicted Fe-Mo cluster-binding NifX family protein